MSQLYVLETNILRGSKKAVIIRTNGVTTQHLAPNPPEEGLEDGEDGEDEIVRGLTGLDEQINPAQNPDKPDKTNPRRPADLFCYICKERLGTNHKQRIGELS